MKKQDPKKKIWVKPEVHTLSIKKDTFSATFEGAEHGSNRKGKIPTP